MGEGKRREKKSIYVLTIYKWNEKPIVFIRYHKWMHTWCNWWTHVFMCVCLCVCLFIFIGVLHKNLSLCLWQFLHDAFFVLHLLDSKFENRISLLFVCSWFVFLRFCVFGFPLTFSILWHISFPHRKLKGRSCICYKIC